MPLVEATLAQAMMKQYEDFKKSMLGSGGSYAAIKSKLNSLSNGDSNNSNLNTGNSNLYTGGNNATNGNSNSGSGNNGNSDGSGNNGTKKPGGNSQISGSETGNREQGNQGGNGSTTGELTNTSAILNNTKSYTKKPKPYVNPNCPVHGEQKPKKCPICGHTDCNCNFHKPPKEQEKAQPPFGFSGNEINPDNIEDLKKQCEEEDKKYDNLLKLLNGDGDGTGGKDDSADAGGNKDDGKANGLGLDDAAAMIMSGEFLGSLSKAIDDELQKATPTMTNLSILIAKGTLSIKPKSNFALYAVELATKVMGYWALCVAPIGIPVSGVITTVMPTNIPALIAPMAQEILMSALQAAPGGDYQKLAEIICQYSRQIIWQVVELIPSVPPVTVPYMVQLQ